ncbi:MAG: F0F1 ATP synthase subunit alpha, partial [Saprospiraceae bacterium]|nr:F0F1 ATP synthase subunit alpha [Saprospiraceae bacterium]
VSRVGGSAQIKSMKKVAGTLKLDQAQYRSLEAFAKFGSDLDPATQAVLEKGKRNVEILKQPQYSPVPVEKQVAIIYLGTNGLLRDVPVEKINEFEELFLTELEKQHASILDNFRAGKLVDQDLEMLRTMAANLSKQYKK